MVSIKDIAACCGVSIATVSKALNDHRDVSESTKRIVRETAKQMGYMPNSQARALKTNKTYNIGVLFVDKAESGLTHSYFASVLDSFKVVAEKMGYDITFISENIGNRKMSYYEHCKYRNVDGIVIACVDFYEKSVVELLGSDIPMVTIDYQSRSQLSVCSNNYDGMRQLVEYVHSKGHTKIAYIYGESSQVTSTRLQSYAETMTRLGIPICDDYLRQARYHNADAATEKIKELLSLHDKPTCILMPDDFSAIGAMTFLEREGISVPGEISIAGFDGINLSQVIRPQLTTLKQDTRAIGAEAAKMLISLIRKEITNDGNGLVIDGSLVEGESVAGI